MSSIKLSDELKLDEAYQRLLGRKLGSEGRDYWLTGSKFRAGSGMTSDNIDSFLTGSDEYRLNQAYKANLGRDVGDEGRAYWLKDGKFTSGATTDNIKSMLIAGAGNDTDKKAAAKTLIEDGITPDELPAHLKEHAPANLHKPLPYMPDKYLDVKSGKMDKVDDTAITDINKGAADVTIGGKTLKIGERYGQKLTDSEAMRDTWKSDANFRRRFGSWNREAQVDEDGNPILDAEGNPVYSYHDGPSTEADWATKRRMLDLDTAGRVAKAKSFGDNLTGRYAGLTSKNYKASKDVEDASKENARESTDLKLGDYATTDALRTANKLGPEIDKKGTNWENAEDLGIAGVERGDVFDISKYTKPTDDVKDDIKGVTRPDKLVLEGYEADARPDRFSLTDDVSDLAERNPFSLKGVKDDIKGVSGADIKDDVKIDTTTPIVNPLSSKWRTAHSLRGQSAMGIRSAQSQRARKGTLGAGTKALSRDMQINTLNV